MIREVDVERLLLLLGGFALHASGLGPPTGCEGELPLAGGGGWGRVRTLALIAALVVRWGMVVPGVERLDSCRRVFETLSADRSASKLLNDLRRGYVLVLPGDPEACREWRSGDARLTTLASMAARVACSNNLCSPLLIGSLIYTAGVASRITPAYHMVAVALGAVGSKACSLGFESLVDALRGRLGGVLDTIAARVRASRDWVAILLAGGVASLCRAVREAERAPRLYTSLVKTLGIGLQGIDPRIYLEEPWVLGAPSDPDEALSRC